MFKLYTQLRLSFLLLFGGYAITPVPPPPPVPNRLGTNITQPLTDNAGNFLGVN